MKSLTTIFIIALTTACSPCYESKFPLSDARKSKIDTLLLGPWTHKESSLPDAYVHRFNNNEYLIALYDPKEDGEKCVREIYRGFNTKIKDFNIINAVEIGEENYIFFIYRISNDTLTAICFDVDVDPSVKKEIGSIKEHYKFIKRQISNNTIKDDEIVTYIRPIKPNQKDQVIEKFKGNDSIIKALPDSLTP